MELAMAISCGCVVFVVAMIVIFGLVRRGKASSSIDLDYGDLVELSKFISTDRHVAHDGAQSSESARVDLILRALESESRLAQR
jgi:hypothetical protein